MSSALRLLPDTFLSVTCRGKTVAPLHKPSIINLSSTDTPNYIVRSVAHSSSTAPMVKAMRIHEVGGPEVLRWEDVEIGEPKEGEIRVKNKAIGLNFIDVYFRKGVYKAATMPFTPGMEAVGEVVAVGPGLTGRKVGDIVAYAGNPMGSYAEEQILPANIVVPVPSTIGPIIAASVMLKGMTAHFLLRRCFKVERGHIVLVHAAAGGVGSLLCQWANALGATVIGTVSTKEKAAQAKEDGCHHVINYKEEDFVARVNELTSGNGVHVVYDSVGKDTFLEQFSGVRKSCVKVVRLNLDRSDLTPLFSHHVSVRFYYLAESLLSHYLRIQGNLKKNLLNGIVAKGSLACLRPRGYMVSFGQSSGMPDPMPLSALAPKSLFLTRPSLMHYNATRDELLESAGEVFTSVVSGILRVRVNRTYPLSKAAQAHADLESRNTSGSVVLIPDEA